MFADKNWHTVSKKINKISLHKLLGSFELINEELSSKKNIEGLKDAKATIKVC